MVSVHLSRMSFVLILTLVASNVYPAATRFERRFAKTVPREMQDKLALEYVESHHNAYIALVWPRAVDQINSIMAELEKHATLIYHRPIVLSAYHDALTVFYHNCHRDVTFDRADYLITNFYLQDVLPPYQVIVILFRTNKSLADRNQIKRDLRNEIGISFWSLHFSDEPRDTLELASVVFSQGQIDMLNQGTFSPTI